MRGPYIATGQDSSLCVSAVVLRFGGDDIVEVVQDREQVDRKRKGRRGTETGEIQTRLVCWWSGFEVSL